MKLQKFKQKSKKQTFIIIFTLFIGLILGYLLFRSSYAFYEEKKEFNVINGTVEDPGDLYFAYYVNNTITREMPNKSSGLTLDTAKSSCTSGVTISWNDNNWQAILDYNNYQKNSTTRTKCTLYFKNKPPLATTLLNNLVSGANTSTTDVYTVPDKTSDSCTYTLAYDGTTDNNLRYVGVNPCNYVTFNGEKAGWRIIGVLNTPEGQRIKLIRNESIGKYSWDTSDSTINMGYGINEWSQADLMKLLNPGYESESVGGSLYYNSKSGNCYSDENNATIDCDFTSNGLTEAAKNQIDTITWKLGGTGNSDSTNTIQFYAYERGTTVYTGRPTEWQGKVGIMYPSDYGYATSGGTSMNRASCLAEELHNWYDSSYSDCYNNDWLYNSSIYQWTLAPDSSEPDYVFGVHFRGRVGINRAYHASLVRPSVYLVSKTSILGGEGTLENPYELSVQ